MAGKTNFSLDELTNVNGNFQSKGQFGVPKAAAPSTPPVADFGKQIGANDVQSWVASNAKNFKLDPNQVGAGVNNQFSISVDPNTKMINITAPDYYIKSPEFKEQVLPVFERLKGQALDDTQIKSLVNSDMVKDIQKQVDAVRERTSAISQFKLEFPDASDDDAVTYLRNAAAGAVSDKDKNTQITYFVEKDGKKLTKSVADAVNEVKNYSDEQRGNLIRDYSKVLEGSEFTTSQKAAALGMREFLRQKDLTKASGRTKVEAALSGIIQAARKGGVTWVADQFTRIGSPEWQTASGQETDAAIEESKFQLDGAPQAMQTGNLVGTVGATIADVIAGNAIGGGTAALVGKAATGTASTANAAAKFNSAMNVLDDAGRSGQVIANTIRTIPSEAAFGGLQAAAKAGDYDSAKEFMMNMAWNAGALSLAKAGGRVLSAVDPEASAKLYGVNQKISQGIVRGWDKVTDLPGIRLGQKFATNFVDSNAPIKRLVRKQYGEGLINKDQMKQAYNDIADLRQRGTTQAVTLLNEMPEFDGVVRTRLSIEDLDDEAAKRATDFLAAVQQKQYHEAGSISLSKETLKKVDDVLARESNNPLFQQYRDDMVKFNTAVVDYFGKPENGGLLDMNIIEEMRKSPAFANGYIHLQRVYEPGYAPKVGKQFKGTDPIQKLRGGDREFADPLAAGVERVYALANLSAQNKVKRIVQQAIDSGMTSGRVLQLPANVKARDDLRVLLKGEKTAVADLVNKLGDDMASDLGKLVDDVEDLYGPGARSIEAMVDDGVEDIVEYISKEPRFQKAIERIVSEVGEGSDASRLAAVEVLGTYKTSLLKQMQKKLMENMGPEDRGFIDRLFRQKIDEQIQLARARVKGVTVEQVDEFNKPFRRTVETVDELDARPAAAPDQTDLAIRDRLDNRPENLRTIEQSTENMSDAERLRLAEGDTGQAGLMSAEAGTRRYNPETGQIETIAPTAPVANAADDAVQVATTDTRIGPVASRLNDRKKELKKLNDELSGVDTAQPNVVQFYENGTKGYMEFDDPVLADYFNAPLRSSVEDGFVAKVLTDASRLFRLTTTGINPVFMLVNPSRDVPFSVITNGVDVLSPQRSYRMIMESSGVPREVADQLMKRIGTSVGMATRVQSAQRADEALGAARKMIRDKGAKGVKETVIAGLDDVKDAAGVSGKVNEVLRRAEAPFNLAEVSVRKRNGAVAYMKAKARGASDEVAEANAMFAAREATTNFLNVGKKVQNFVRTVPYLTAAINGQASFLRLWQLDPIGVTTRLAAGAVTPAIYLTMNNLKDEDTANAYLDIPEWERRNNFIIMLGPDNIVKIPMPQEVADLINPFIETVEANHGLDKNTFDIIARAVLGGSPVDLSGFTERDIQGNIDVGAAVMRTAGNLTPQAVRPIVEGLSGRSMYTGQALGPTDIEMIESGQVEPGEEITAGDRSFESKKSMILGKIADLTGIDQYRLQNVVNNYTGTVGNLLLNAADKMAGASEEEQGGKGLLDSIAKRFFGKSYSQATQDYYKGLNKLEDEKEKVQARLQAFSQNAYYEEENGDLDAEKRQAMIDDYGEKVADFAGDYGRFYERVGGMKPFQLDGIIRLLDFGPDYGGFAPGSYQEGMVQDVRNESRNQAVRSATDLGLPTDNDRDRYGRLYADTAGNIFEDFTNTSLANQNIRTRVYGSGKQAAFEFEQMLKGDKKEGIPNLYDAYDNYFDDIGKLYDEAKGLKGAAATEIYGRISDLQEKYMTEEFDKRIKPLIDQYGPAILRNKEVMEAVSSRIMIPSDFTPFFSKKKTPYLQKDVEAYLLDRYGVGEINRTNTPNDAQAMKIIEEVNADLSGGRTSSAAFKLEDLQEDIDSGKVYVDTNVMNDIKRLLQLSSRRR